jgi:hypothetical protein
MYWYESQEQPGSINITFPVAQAETLRAACSERIAERILKGNSALVFDETVIEIVDGIQDQSSVELIFGSASFHELPHLLDEFARRTSEVAGRVDPHLSDVENYRGQMHRRDLGSAATILSMDIEAAVMAHDSGFHGKLDAFLHSLNPET